MYLKRSLILDGGSYKEFFLKKIFFYDAEKFET
jgi:hypothetical protein